MAKALEGITILDFSRVLAGPYCTMLLADLGAEVIKVELPGFGDDTRHFGPYVNGESAYFALVNRGKKSIELDLKNPEHIDLIKEMVRDVDVVVENFRPGVIQKLGLDYETLKAINPGLVYTSISGFGQNTSLSHRPAYDLVAQAIGGMASITGYADSPPTRTGNSLGDMSAALYAAYGTMVALFHKQRTGVGQFVDISMVDSIFAMLETNVLRYTINKEVPQRIGSRHPISTPFDIFKTKDDYLVIAIANNRLFEKFCEAIQMPELSKDERFVTDELRTENETQLKEIIESWLANYTSIEAEKILEQSGIPASRINTIKDIAEDPLMAERDMLIDVEHPTAGTMRITGNPVKLSETPAQINKIIPVLGVNNEEIFEKYKKLV